MCHPPVLSGFSWVTSEVKGSEAVFGVIFQSFTSVVSKKPKISFLYRKMDSADRLNKADRTIQVPCLVTI